MIVPGLCKIEGFVKITDPNTGEVLVDKKNAIHYENISIAMAQTLSDRNLGYIYQMAFGNGGSAADAQHVAAELVGRFQRERRAFAAVALPLMLAFGFFSNLLYAAIGSLLRNWLSGPVVNGIATAQRLRWFNCGMAAVLVATAFWMARL